MGTFESQLGQRYTRPFIGAVRQKPIRSKVLST